jgi:hypothetical protein
MKHDNKLTWHQKCISASPRNNSFRSVWIFQEKKKLADTIMLSASILADNILLSADNILSDNNW